MDTVLQRVKKVIAKWYKTPHAQPALHPSNTGKEWPKDRPLSIPNALCYRISLTSKKVRLHSKSRIDGEITVHVIPNSFIDNKGLHWRAYPPQCRSIWYGSYASEGQCWCHSNANTSKGRITDYTAKGVSFSAIATSSVIDTLYSILVSVVQ